MKLEESSLKITTKASGAEGLNAMQHDQTNCGHTAVFRMAIATADLDAEKCRIKN